MKNFINFVTIIATVFAVSCQREVIIEPKITSNDSNEEVMSNVRSYDEALKIAEDAINQLDKNTRVTSKRTIKRNEGQTVMRPVTRGGVSEEEPALYIFNHENHEGFTIIAADKSQPSLIAVTDKGSYTYGEPTGVEPFDLLMEDMSRAVIILPPIDMNPPVKYERRNELRNGYGPLTNIQWGLGSIYGAYYPDGVAYDEAAAIAQGLMCTFSDFEYEITNPNSPLYGQTVTIDKNEMKKHLRYDHPAHDLDDCTEDIHNQISTLYLEIGYRLSNGTTINLSNKTRPFTMAKIKEVYASFGSRMGANINYFDGQIISPHMDQHYGTYDEYIFIFRGTLDSDEDLIEGGYAHAWLANGFMDYTYDEVEYTKNSLINPSHPYPNGYTETGRVAKQEYMLYINWGYDGISNGWFHNGCFDMSQRIEDEIILGGYTDEYDYNFVDISYFAVTPVIHAS